MLVVPFAYNLFKMFFSRAGMVHFLFSLLGVKIPDNSIFAVLVYFRHGITQEPHAVRHYENTLRSRGHQIQTTCCGLMVNPSSPWLGASPDRRVFDPAETPPHGVVEVKCPYTMWNCDTPDSKSFFVVKHVAGVCRLKRDHSHYYQLLGQMALSGVTWGDFVVYCKNFLIIERIRFCPSSWIKCKEVLDKFYFETLLPYQVGRPDQ